MFQKSCSNSCVHVYNSLLLKQFRKWTVKVTRTFADSEVIVLYMSPFQHWRGKIYTCKKNIANNLLFYRNWRLMTLPHSRGKFSCTVSHKFTHCFLITLIYSLWKQEKLTTYNNSQITDCHSPLSGQLFITFNPLTPMNDQDRISSYNINTISTRQVMRIKKNINLGIISWTITKFSELTS